VVVCGFLVAFDLLALLYRPIFFWLFANRQLAFSPIVNLPLQLPKRRPKRLLVKFRTHLTFWSKAAVIDLLVKFQTHLTFWSKAAVIDLLVKFHTHLTFWSKAAVIDLLVKNIAQHFLWSKMLLLCVIIWLSSSVFAYM